MRQKNNVEFVTDTMDFSKNGALMQVFVMTALEKYADLCIEAGAARFDSGLMNGDAWIRCAHEVKGGLEAHFDPKEVET